MITPAVTHVPCALDQQRRLREARTASLTRSAGRRWWSRVPRPRVASADIASGLGTTGENVWGALRV